MSSFFTAFSDLFTPRPTTVDWSARQQLKAFPAHVLEVCVDENSPLYNSPKDIGAIRIRHIVNEWNKEEKLCRIVAYPLNRNTTQIPLPGEEVICYRAYGQGYTPVAGGAIGSPQITNGYFYDQVVGVLHNPTYNSYPFVGTDSYHIDLSNPFISFDVAKRRFDKKVKDLARVKQGDDTKVFKALKPTEGDVIYRGRFGQSVLFGSTTDKIKRSDGSYKGGAAGDGVIVLRLDRDSTVNEKELWVEDDINTDDAAMYFLSSQNIELQLACSTKLNSWKQTFELPQPGSEDAGNVLSSGKDSSELWQKPIDTTKPTSEAFQNPEGTTPLETEDGQPTTTQEQDAVEEPENP